MVLPQIKGLLKVMAVCNSRSKWLPATCHLATKMSVFVMTSLPKDISEASVVPTSAIHNGSSGEIHPLLNSQPSQTHTGVQGDGLLVNFNPSTLQVVGHVDTTDSSECGP